LSERVKDNESGENEDQCLKQMNQKKRLARTRPMKMNQEVDFKDEVRYFEISNK